MRWFPGSRTGCFAIFPLTNLMARGEAAQDARSAMCGASLAALPKEEGDHRPIAVGEVLRRVVGKTLAEASKEDARSLLEPFQVGVGTGGGCEAVVHVVRKWLGIHGDPCLRQEACPRQDRP